MQHYHVVGTYKNEPVYMLHATDENLEDIKRDMALQMGRHCRVYNLDDFWKSVEILDALPVTYGGI